MSDSTQLRRISVMRETKSANPIGLLISSPQRTKAARSLASGRFTMSSMLRDVVMRTLGFGEHFVHAGERGTASPALQAFALRRRRQPHVGQTTSVHRFHWPTSGTMPSSRSAIVMGPSQPGSIGVESGAFETSAGFDGGETADFEFGHPFIEADVAPWFAPIALEPDQPVGAQIGLRPIESVPQSPRMPLQRAAIASSVPNLPSMGEARMRSGERVFDRRTFPIQSGERFDSVIPGFDTFFGGVPDEPEHVATPLSPFQIARQLSGEGAAAGAPRSGFVPLSFVNRASGWLAQTGARAAIDSGQATLQQVLQRTSWKPFERTEVATSAAVPAYAPTTTSAPNWLSPVNAATHDLMPLSAGATMSPGLLPAAPFTLSSPSAPVIPDSGLRRGVVQAESTWSDTRSQRSVRNQPVAMPVVNPGSLQMTPGRGGSSPFGFVPTRPRAETRVSAEGQPAGYSTSFPTVLRRAMAGPESRSWSETGPISPIWGELGQLIQPQPHLQSLSRAQANFTAQPELTLPASRPVDQSISSPIGAPSTPFRARTEGRSFAAAVTWDPPTTIAATFPPVFRSAMIDRAEPRPEHQQAAHSIMTSSSGSPLPALVRRSMEERLGADFSSVRVHSGSSIGRATDLLAARAMSRGSDVFMPSGVPDQPHGDAMPLLAHELSHVASHLGQPASAAVQRAPLVLAQRASSEETRAEEVERAVSSEMLSRGFPTAGGAQPGMTLARAMTSMAPPAMPLTVARSESPAPVQRDDTTSAVATAVEPAATAPTEGDPADASKLAEKVYALLERRLVVERERGGYRRT